MGNIAKAAAAASSGGSSTTFLIIIVVIFILFYFLLIRPQRNRQRKVQEQQRGIRPGQRVKTTAGMYATVVAVDGDDVVLEIAPNVEVRYMKRAIMEVLGEGIGVPAEQADAAAEDPVGEDHAAPDDEVAAESAAGQVVEDDDSAEAVDDQAGGATGDVTGRLDDADATDEAATGGHGRGSEEASTPTDVHESEHASKQ